MEGFAPLAADPCRVSHRGPLAPSTPFAGEVVAGGGLRRLTLDAQVLADDARRPGAKRIALRRAPRCARGPSLVRASTRDDCGA